MCELSEALFFTWCKILMQLAFTLHLHAKNKVWYCDNNQSTVYNFAVRVEEAPSLACAADALLVTHTCGGGRNSSDYMLNSHHSFSEGL